MFGWCVVLLISALLLLTLTSVALVAWWRLERQAQQLAQSLRRVAVLALDAQLRLESQARLARAQQFAENAFDLTHTTVRAVHRGIASIPFTLLARNPETKDKALRVQAIHDETADAVYEGLSAINRLVGRGVRRSIGVRDTPDSDAGHRTTDGATPTPQATPRRQKPPQ